MKPKKNYPDEVFLNGKWMKPKEAYVSVFDRCFMFGDGIYEVTPVYEGKPFKLKAHLERLQYCLNEVQIPLDAFSLEETMLEAVSRAGFSERDSAVYIQVSRGTAPRTHYFPEDPKPTLLLYAFPVNLRGFESKSWNVLVSEDKRWHRCDIKSTALMANIMANEKAISADYDENLLYRKGYFTEGSHSTAFFVKNDKVFTHPEGPHILSGVTRKEVIKMCIDLNIPVKEEKIHLDELVEIEEIFLTGTTTQILSVASLHSGEKEIYRSDIKTITGKLQQEFIRRTRG